MGNTNGILLDIIFKLDPARQFNEPPRQANLIVKQNKKSNLRNWSAQSQFNYQFYYFMGL